jgi:site-specific recombinase XerD
MQSTITAFDNTAEGWERSLYAFLAEKERRSGSRRTVEGYSRMLQHFFASVGKPPDRVTSPEVFAWGYGVGLSGKQPSSVTIGARLACLSSFYRFLIRMDIVAANPCDALERPRVQVAPPRGLTADDIRKLHIFRHSAAKLRRDAGESIENVSRFLDHSSLQVTSIYLRRLEGEADGSWGKVAAAIGV